MNERAIFEVLLRDGVASRSELMRGLGVTAPTIHKAVASLLAAGLVEEVGVDVTNRAGRPSMVYRVATTEVQVVGVALDVRQTSVVTAGLDGQLHPDSLIQFKTPATYKELVQMLATCIGERTGSGVKTLGIGISVPGEVDVDAQRVLLSPNLHITDGKSLSADLHERTGFRAVMYPETIGTCLAEWSHGAARGFSDFVMIGVYEGYGASIVSDGRLLRSRNGIGSEMGHVTVDIHGERCGCGNRGCIETVATDQAFARRVSNRVDKRLSVEKIVSLVQAGMLDVRAELDETLSYLAIGAGAAINIFNPQAVLLCSRMFDVDAHAFDRLLPMIHSRTLKPLREKCRIIRAEGDTRRGAIASIVRHITGNICPPL
ncbi:MAG: ROK family protein [Tepidisphaeraceae bacterium]